MSIIKFIYNTNLELFKTSESSINDSLIDDEPDLEPDLEAGEGYYYKKLKEALLTEDTSTLEDTLEDTLEFRDTSSFKNALNFDSNLYEYDLEMGDKSIISEEVNIKEVNIEECNIKKYLSFVIKYFCKTTKT
jgi:hypothetical protein